MTEAWRQLEGQVVDGEFPLEQYLGGSARSAVFLTRPGGQDPRKAAIKLVRAREDAELELSRKEQAAKLSHPNLLPLLRVGRCRLNEVEHLYVVMEYAEENLSQLLPQRPLSAAEAREVLAPILDALAYLHDNGFAHARIKPANILAVKDHLKVSSDGVCPIGEPRPDPEKPDAYAPPEAGRGLISAAGDVWSLGVTLVEALTQHPPAEHREPALPETLPAPFLEIARGCLRRDPARRSTLDEIARQWDHPLPRRAAGAGARAQLSEEASATAVAAPEMPREPEPARPRRASPKRRHLVPFLGGLGLAAVVLVPMLVNRRTAKEAPPPYVAPEQPSVRVEEDPAPVAPETQQPAQEEGQIPPAIVAAVPPVPSDPSPEAGRGRIDGEVTHQIVPEVPQSVRSTIRGTLKLSVRVRVNPAGEVAAAELDSHGPSKYFARLALEAAQRWRFSPAEVAGRGVPSEWKLRFEFTRDGTRVIPVQERL
jgi:TonB family protein